MFELAKFQPVFSFDYIDIKKINRLTGAIYNDDLYINFIKMNYSYKYDSNVVKVYINNFGCIVEGFVPISYIERIFGMDISLFEMEYVLYAINKRSISHGIKFTLINEDDYLPNNLMECNIKKDEVSLKAFLDLDSIFVDEFFIKNKPLILKKNIKLSISMTLFSQSVEAHDIRLLSKEDALIIK